MSSGVPKSRSHSPRSRPKQNSVTFNALVLGNATVGKTTLWRSFMQHGGGPYLEETERTSELVPDTKEINFPFTRPPYKLKAIVIDTAGQERYRSLVNTFYRRMHVIIAVVDSKDPSTLNDLVAHWIPAAKEHAPAGCAWIVAINKSDIYHETKEMAKAKREVFEKMQGSPRPHKRSSRKHAEPKSSKGASSSTDTDAATASSRDLTRLPASADEVRLPQLTIDEVYKAVGSLLSIEKTDVMYTSGRYGYNVNALFLRAIWRGLSTMPTLTDDIRGQLMSVTQQYSVEHFTSDYHTFKMVKELAARAGTTELVEELQPPTPIHLTPRDNSSSSSSSSAAAAASATLTTSASDSFISRNQVEAIATSRRASFGPTVHSDKGDISMSSVLDGNNATDSLLGSKANANGTHSAAQPPTQSSCSC